MTSDQPSNSDDGEKSPVDAPKDSIREAMKVIFIAALLALGLRILVYDPYNISSHSMLPSLMVEDYVLVSKFAYGYGRYSLPLGMGPANGRWLARPFERGDVVVFRPPWDRSNTFIKRLIGFPGDRIQMIGGRLHINGSQVPRRKVDDFIVPVTANSPCFGEEQPAGNGTLMHCHYDRYREELPNGIGYYTLDLGPNAEADNTREFVVPQGHLFVMGDNRDISADSRMSPSHGVHYVPMENVIGRAEAIFVSLNGEAPFWQFWRWGESLRLERVFTGVS